MTITITGTNDAPTLTLASNTLHVNEDNSIALNIGTADVDTNASLSVTITGVPSDATLNHGSYQQRHPHLDSVASRPRRAHADARIEHRQCHAHRDRA